jgi:hypothetical protein
MQVITVPNLKVNKPSDAWTVGLQASLRAFARRGDPLTTGLLDSSWSGPEAIHLLYSVGLKTIAEPNALDSIDLPICWRFVAGGATGIASACVASYEHHGLPPKIGAAMRAPEMADLLADTTMLNRLSVLTDHPETQWELRVIRVPALYVEAFWLKCSTPGGPDWMVPYGLLLDGHGQIKLSGGGTLTRNQAYPAPDFLGLLATAARHKLGLLKAQHAKAEDARHEVARPAPEIAARAPIQAPNHPPPAVNAPAPRSRRG